MKKKNLILITGIHRSGTSWTGNTIAFSKNIKYIIEPFHPHRDRKNCPMLYYYQFIDNNDSSIEQESVKRYINSICYSPTFYINDRIKQSIKNNAPLKNIGKLFFKKAHYFGRPLMKDPLAILSAEWIYTTFNADVVIILRHPAAFIGSIKAAGWSFPFSHLLAQERMLNVHFKEFVPLIEQYSRVPPDIIDQGILIWNIIYTRIKYYRSKYPDEWYYVKHETLSTDPISEFTKLYTFLDIEFSEKIKEKIIKSTNGSIINKRLSRDSIQNLNTWKARLTPEEIIRIKSGTSNVYSFFYEEKDWI